MKLMRALAFLLIALPCALAAPQSGPPTSPATLPTVTAYALDRQKVTLPADFKAARNVLILGFALDQQQAVDDWFEAAGPDDASRLQRWILPLFAKENFIYRWWQNASLRGRLAPTQPRHSTVPLYVDEAQFLRPLQLPSQEDVVVLVTDKTGQVLWQARGPVDETKKTALAAFLKQP